MATGAAGWDGAGAGFAGAFCVGAWPEVPAIGVCGLPSGLAGSSGTTTTGGASGVCTGCTSVLGTVGAAGWAGASTATLRASSWRLKSMGTKMMISASSTSAPMTLCLSMGYASADSDGEESCARTSATL
ncbi:hypothetical protein BGI51_20030 [Pseudomonas oryzihabitans]|nr:hypothetical protein BGI51_20030 [Pseudomonas psychrotolerans]